MKRNLVLALKSHNRNRRASTKRNQLSSPDQFIHYTLLKDNSKHFNQDKSYSWERRLANTRAMEIIENFKFNVRVALRYRNQNIGEFKLWLRDQGSPFYRFFMGKHKLLSEYHYTMGKSLRPIHDLTDLILIAEKVQFPLSDLLFSKLDGVLNIDMTKKYMPTKINKRLITRKKKIEKPKVIKSVIKPTIDGVSNF